jgi:hypothetical protein
VPASCARHPDRAAAFACDGCGKTLCDECVEEGHRLLFCRLCGERALPLAARGPATTPERERQRLRGAVYGLREALGYPLRGLGRYLFFGWVAVAVLRNLPSAALAFWPSLAYIAVLALAPGLLLAIVRTTMEGATELPDWPDFFDAGERVSEIGAFVLLAAVCLLPAIGLLKVSGCGPREMLAGEWGLVCWLAVFAGIAVGVVLGFGGLATVAVTQSSWSALRVDLHLRFLRAAAPDSLRTAGGIAGLLIGSELLQLVLRPLPIAGGIVAAVIDVYAVLLAPHLLGLVLRRHMSAVEDLYGGV